VRPWLPNNGSVAHWTRFVLDCRMHSFLDSARVLVNKSMFIARRTLGRLDVLPWDQTDGWLDSPFSLRGRIAWSPASRTWYVLEDEGAPLAMAEIRDEPAEWMLDTLASGMTVIDIGAHQGRYAIRFSQKVGATGLVVAVEPSARNQAVLAQNLELNGIRNVKSVQAACWSRRDALEFQPGITLDLFRVGESRGRKQDTIGLPLDELAESLSLQRVDLLKIDVEGAELEVLEGGKAMLGKFRPRVFLEFHGTLTGSIEWLRDHGYRVQRKQDDPWTERFGWIWAVPADDGGAAFFGEPNDLS
jgi:FkbM family methyltransferase